MEKKGHVLKLLQPQLTIGTTVVFNIPMGSQGKSWENMAKGIINMLVIGEEVTWENMNKFYKSFGLSNECGNVEVKLPKDEECFPGE